MGREGTGPPAHRQGDHTNPPIRQGIDKPSHCTHASALQPLGRARQTAEILQRLLRPRLTVQLCDELVPEAAPHALFTLLGTFAPDSVVLCVGHEPQPEPDCRHLADGKALCRALAQEGRRLLSFIMKSLSNRQPADFNGGSR